VTRLESELRALHHDLRIIAKAYIARLENDLLVCLAVLRSYGRSTSCLARCCTRSAAHDQLKYVLSRALSTLAECISRSVCVPSHS